MTKQLNSNETGDASEQLEAGLKQCRELVADLRQKLGYQASDPFTAVSGDDGDGMSNVND